VVRRGGGARRRAKGKLSRSFFLLRLGNVEWVRVGEGGGRTVRGKDFDVLVVRDGRSGGGASDRGDVGEGEQGRQGRSFRAVYEVEFKGGGARWRGYGPKGFFGRVLELGGRSATRREQVIEGSDAWREDVVDVGEDTSGCGGPWDTYSGRGGTSIGVVIRIGMMKEIKRIGHWTLRSARGSDCPNVRNALLINPWGSGS
jgi:hypothetical protein